LNLLRQLAITQFKLKDQSAILGFVWSFLHPLVMLGILFALFRIRAGHSIEHYAVYLLIGVVQYTHFSNATTRSITVLYSMRRLTSDAIFPKETLVLSAVAAETVELAVSMLICLAIAVVSGVALSSAVLLLPLVCLMQVALVAAVSLLLSCLYVFVRDLAHIYQAFLRLLLFVTPIFYEPAFLHDVAGRYIVLFNPLAHLIELSRMAIIEGRVFPAESVIFLLLGTAVLLLLSFRIFRTYEPSFVEHL
jgi:ABC-2 type transport system permease protein